jgi:protein O-mannosyl-transferase
MNAPFSPPRGEAAALPALLSILLIVAVAWTGREIAGFGYALLMDDDANILFNPHLGELDRARLWWMFTDIDYVSRYMPLGWLSFNVVATWTDLSPAACHIAGVVFHALNAVVVFSCLRRLLRRFVEDAFKVDQTLAAGAGALLWALHPLRVEPVAWCSGLLYVEGGFFALVCVYARLRELEARTAGASGSRGWFGAAVIAFVVSVLIYPVALFLPAVIVVLDYVWMEKESHAVRRIVARESWMFVVIGGLGLSATILARQANLLNALPSPTLAEFGVGSRAFQAAYVWASYLWRTVWPFHLTPGVEAIFEIRASDPRIWAALPTLLVASFFAWRWRRTLPFLGACWICYLFWMVPVLGLMEHPHVASDRYSYLAGILFSVILAFSLLRFSSARMRAAGLVLAAILAACCSILSYRQARLWRDSLSVHRHIFARLQDSDLRNITLARIAKLQFLDGDVRGGRALVEKIYAEAPHIGGVARYWREMAPERPLSPEIAARELQEWQASPWASLHERIAADMIRAGRLNDALVRLNAALVLSSHFTEARFRRALLLAELNQPRAALHDWLVLEATNDGRTLATGAMQFAAKEIAAAFRAADQERLAERLLQRAGPGPAVNAGVIPPSAR